MRVSAPLLTAAALAVASVLAAHPAGPSAPPAADDEVIGRYVRLELPGLGRILSLAEVEVVRDGKNVAVRKAARQSSTDHGGEAVLAVDGDRDGVHANGSVSHTAVQEAPWWEVDLGRSGPIQQVTVWNRADCCQERLEGLRVQVLDESREVVWEQADGPIPRPRHAFVLGDSAPIDIGPSPVARARRQEAINKAIGRGVDYLVQMQQPDGSWGHATNNYGPGATGLVLYTLLKQNVPKSHQAIRRGFAYLRGARPVKTYSLSTVLLAFCELGQEQDLDRIESMVELLLDWQESPGADGRVREMWAYPHGIADHSNTQFAALALRAAHLRDVHIPKDAWTGMLEATFDHRGEEEDAGDIPRGDRSRSGLPQAAGFRYRTSDGHGGISGSMTTAGLSIIAIVREGLGGKIPRRWSRDAQRAQETGLNWLAQHFVAGRNPGRGGAWHGYYLYGVERVGALFEVDKFGVHDWYWEGAANLLQRQHGAGQWGGEPDTCFALLFLSRATSATTGLDSVEKEDTWIAEGPDDSVRWRVLGDEDSVTMFLTGFSEATVVDASFDEGPSKGLRVVDVRYFVNGEEIAHIPGDPGRAWNRERFPTRHRFAQPQTARAHCEVTVLDPDAEGPGTATRVLQGRELEIVARRGWAPWMDEAARATAENLLRESGVTTEASSHNADGQEPAKAVDGNFETRWICSPGEEAPEITLDLDRSERADVLLLYGLARNDRELHAFDVARRYEVWIDRDDEPRIVEALADPLAPARLELDRPESIRRIRIRIAERTRGERYGGQAGLAEVALLMSR